MIGIVMGELFFAHGPEMIRERRWVQVRAGTQLLEAVDLVGCSGGDAVLVLTGESARTVAMDCPGDWAVAAVLSGQGNNG